MSKPLNITSVVVCDLAQEISDGRYNYLGVYPVSVQSTRTSSKDFAPISIVVTFQPQALEGRYRMRVVHEDKKSGVVMQYEAEEGSVLEESDRITIDHQVSIRHLGFGTYDVMFGPADGELEKIHSFVVMPPRAPAAPSNAQDIGSN